MVQYLEYSPVAELARQPLPEWSSRILHIRTTITELASASIPFAMLKHNPLPEFQHSLAEITQHHFEDQTHATLAVQNAWNQSFAPFEPHQIFFLYAWSSVPGASPKVRHMAGLTFGIATPGDDYKRWLTTYAVHRQGELVAWCEEIDMTGIQQKMVEIVLTETGMIRLPTTGVYNCKGAE